MFIDNDDKLISGKINHLLNNDVIFPLHQDFKFKKILNGTIFKRDSIQKYNLRFINTTYYEDFYIVYRLYEHTSMTCSDEPMYYYRHNTGGICNSLSNQKKIEELKKVQDFFKNQPCIDQVKANCMISNYILQLIKN